MSRDWEFVRHGERADPYEDLLLAAQEARIRADLIASLQRDFPSHPRVEGLLARLHNERRIFADRVAIAIHLLTGVNDP